MRATVVALVLALCAASAHADVVRSIDEARTVDALRRIAARLEPRIHGGQDDYRVLLALADAARRLACPDVVAPMIERAEARFETSMLDGLRKARVDLLADAGRVEEAIALARMRLAAAASDKDRFHVHRQLGRLYERIEDWGEALRNYEVLPPISHCGTCREVLATERVLDVARCRFHLGRIDAALESLHAQVVRESVGDGRVGSAGTMLCEYAARSSRLAWARERIEALEGEARPGLLHVLDLASAFAASDAVGFLALAEQGYAKNEFHLDWEAGLLTELGDPAKDALREGVLRGGRAALLLTRLTGWADLVPALRTRMATTEDPQERALLADVIEDLEGAA